MMEFGDMVAHAERVMGPEYNCTMQDIHEAYATLKNNPIYRDYSDHEFTESPSPEDWRCRICGFPLWVH